MTFLKKNCRERGHYKEGVGRKAAGKAENWTWQNEKQKEGKNKREKCKQEEAANQMSRVPGARSAKQASGTYSWANYKTINMHIYY